MRPRGRRQLCSEERRIVIPELGVEQRFDAMAEGVAHELNAKGWFTAGGFLGSEACQKMRSECESLFESGHFSQSKSLSGAGLHFDKPGVFACELDGSSYDQWEAAPHLLAYTREVILSVPDTLNRVIPGLQLSSRVYGTKLAVATGNGSKYPRHVDNSGGAAGGFDMRKITFIYYMNPGWDASNGGALRVFEGDDGYVDTMPDGDRLVVFHSDKCLHEVMPNEDPDSPRYALTLWLTTEDAGTIASGEQT